jgi:hypothetical protein
MVYTINLNWLAFNVNLTAVYTAIKALASDCCGMSGNSQLQVHFTDQPSDDEVAAIQAYWASLTPSSTEATSYQTAEQMAAAAAATQAANIASATTKLETLGLTSAEIAAILGQ